MTVSRKSGQGNDYNTTLRQHTETNATYLYSFSADLIVSEEKVLAWSATKP